MPAKDMSLQQEDLNSSKVQKTELKRSLKELKKCSPNQQNLT